MNAEIDTIKIEMTKKEVFQLKREILNLLNNFPMQSDLEIRSANPKINEFICILEIDLEKIPF